MNWTLIFEIAALIVAIIGLIPIYFLIKKKAKKRYKFDLNYGNIFFASVWDPNNERITGRLCLVVYGITIVNGSDEPNTLKNILLSYQFGRKRYQTDSFVIPNGKSPSGEPSIAITNAVDNIVLVGWHNARAKLGKKESLQPGSVFSGSAVFLFEPTVTNLHNLRRLKILVKDYYGNKSVYPLVIKEEWFKTLNSGFRIINEPYMLGNDGSIKYEQSSERKGK